MANAPDFSRWAASYAKARPGYPPELFAHLASLVERRDAAWDCGTGSGQAAQGLVEHFKHVIGTDYAPGQIAQAMKHPRIEYRVAPAESSGLDAASVDAISIAQALHWFDFDAFFAEAQRVIRPGGVLAAYAYQLTRITPAIDAIVERFYWDVVRPHFPLGTQYVDSHYETIDFPGEPLPEATFTSVLDWTLVQFIAYVQTWSGTRRGAIEHAPSSFRCSCAPFACECQPAARVGTGFQTRTATKQVNLCALRASTASPVTPPRGPTPARAAAPPR
jgi:SAM-dependent methyltransferase